MKDERFQIGSEQEFGHFLAGGIMPEVLYVKEHRDGGKDTSQKVNHCEQKNCAGPVYKAQPSEENNTDQAQKFNYWRTKFKDAPIGKKIKPMLRYFGFKNRYLWSFKVSHRPLAQRSRCFIKIL